MKYLFFAIAVFFVTSTSNKVQAQDSADISRQSLILQSYYNIKDALVAGNNQIASESANNFIKNLKDISSEIISKANVNSLLKGAAVIADAKTIDKQRVAFAGLSTELADVAISLKSVDEPIYVQYCPMKKAVWLSNEKNIKNPYYGKAMLTCGSIKTTL